jgi:hypothetical protein
VVEDILKYYWKVLNAVSKKAPINIISPIFKLKDIVQPKTRGV